LGYIIFLFLCCDFFVSDYFVMLCGFCKWGCNLGLVNGVYYRCGFYFYNNLGSLFLVWFDLSVSFYGFEAPILLRWGAIELIGC
jgi:hypothetical protein